MATAELTQVNFQEQMQARIRASIGDLMPDAMLADIVQKGIDKAFNEKRTVEQRNSYGYSSQFVEKEPWLQEFLRTELKSQVEDQAKAWVAANGDKVHAIVQKYVDEGIAEALVRAFQSLFNQPLQDFASGMNDKLRALGSTTTY
jgi:hypothetical protein